MTKEEKFETLYQMYWRYVYEYEVGYSEHFIPSDLHRKDFQEQLRDEGMCIKVKQGY